MREMVSCGGQELRDMFAAGSDWLEKSVPDINAINVFPVPDGDTGTNMLLTMRSTMEEAARAPLESASAVAKAMAQGALMGARGNSGVIMSQFFRGLAKGLDEKESITGIDWALALSEASRTAYKGLSQPVEGTMLTVLRDAAMAAEVAARGSPEDVTNVAEAAVKAAKDSVARTPLLLPVLREAGVVDAGGQGVYVLLQKLDPDKIRKKLEDKGQSVVVVGDEAMVRVHIHTYDPGSIIRYATSLGTLHQIQVQNMDDQHVGFIEMQEGKLPTSEIATIAVASGSGMKDVVQSLGAAAVVTGGQTMNPSVQEILQAVESVPSQKVILLPNNKNIILTASQVQPLTSKEVAVIPTRTLPQGVAALIAFNYEGTLEENAQAMKEAVATVKTVEVTRAVRSTQIKGLKVRKGQAIAVVDDEEIVAAGDSATQVLFEAIDEAGVESLEVVTVYYGGDVEVAEAEQIVQKIRNKYPEKQVEMVSGGQPHYDYIVSLE